MQHVTEVRSDGIATSAQDKGTIERFDRVLVESGDLVRLRPEAVSLFLAVRHYLRTREDGEETRFPDNETLQGLTALDARQVEAGLDSLYRCGYLDREPRRSDKDAAPVYRLREKSIWYDNEGQVAGEVSWDLPVSPAGLVGLPEFRNILMSDRLRGAKVVHIERLQVNVSGARDGGISVNALTVADEHSSATQQQLSKLLELLEQVSKQWAGVVPEAESAPARVEAAPLPKSKAKDAAPAPAQDEGMADMAEFEKLYHQYVERVHGEFVSALKKAEDAADEAYRNLVEQQVAKPRRPVGLGALLRGNRWQQEYDSWKKQQALLQSAYDVSVKERQRLIEALMLSRNGEQPLYVREALDQLRQDYPALWARTKQARKSRF